LDDNSAYLRFHVIPLICYAENILFSDCLLPGL